MGKLSGATPDAQAAALGQQQQLANGVAQPSNTQHVMQQQPLANGVAAHPPPAVAHPPPSTQHPPAAFSLEDLRVACSLREQRTSVAVLLCGTSGTGESGRCCRGAGLLPHACASGLLRPWQLAAPICRLRLHPAGPPLVARCRAGKSTLAALLAARLGISTVVSTDSIRHMLRRRARLPACVSGLACMLGTRAGRGWCGAWRQSAGACASGWRGSCTNKLDCPAAPCRCSLQLRQRGGGPAAVGLHLPSRGPPAAAGGRPGNAGSGRAGGRGGGRQRRQGRAGGRRRPPPAAAPRRAAAAWVTVACGAGGRWPGCAQGGCAGLQGAGGAGAGTRGPPADRWVLGGAACGVMPAAWAALRRWLAVDLLSWHLRSG